MNNIAWATDIHLNTVEKPAIDRFCEDVKASGAESLLLGGDVAEAGDLVRWLDFLDKSMQMPIYFVLGNHDYYGSSVAAVRQQVRDLQSPNLIWLPDAGCVQFGSDVCLVGHGGWGDARVGDLVGFAVLTDYLAISDLFETVDLDDLVAGFTNRLPLRRKLGLLGQEAARTLRPVLFQAVQEARRVLVLMHVPPFREACWHAGSISSEKWLPGFTCKAIGDLLLETAELSPDCDITVLCGHTHGTGYVRMASNLEVYTAQATYGRIYFRAVDVNGLGIKVKAT
jgi:Icc protein